MQAYGHDRGRTHLGGSTQIGGVGSNCPPCFMLATALPGPYVYLLILFLVKIMTTHMRTMERTFSFLIV